MRTFNIHYQGQEITVSQESPEIFQVTFPGKKLQLLKKEDNEGADHWFEDGSDNETPETAAIGAAIDVELKSR